MAIIRWDPFADLRTIHGQVDDMFNQMVSGHHAQLAPTTDIYTTDNKEMIVETHLPNFKENEVSVDVHQGTLEIRADHHEKEQDKTTRKYLVRESSSSFYRRVALPERADDAGITASFKNGMLTITVPFKELPKPQRISIDSGKKK